MIPGQEVPTLVNGGSEITVPSEEVTREFSIRWKHANRKMIAADGNWSNSTKVAESLSINIHGITISFHIYSAKSTSEQVIIRHRWEQYAGKCERKVDNGRCKITISAINGSEQVNIVATCPAHKRDGFASCSGNFYPYLQ